MAAAAKVWHGANALRRLLVPVESLEPFPGNPRLGDVAAVRASLERFGQTKAIVVDAATPTRIVAGHHVRLAAADAGWTHVAAQPHEFADDDEARAYLLADNRSSELGAWDIGLLAEHISYLADLDALGGTGYTADDLDGFLADLAKIGDGELVDVSFQAKRKSADVREVVLMYSPAQFEQVEVWLGIVKKETGVDGVSEACYEALRLAAAQLNG